MALVRTTARRTAMAVLAAGAAYAAVSIPAASADPAPVPDCTASGLSATISSVTNSLSEWFAANPDANQALIDATRQPAFSAIGAFDSFFRDHPQQADQVRAVKQPLVDFQNQCGMQVEPAEALVVLGEL
jgi:hemophore-related protein